MCVQHNRSPSERPWTSLFPSLCFSFVICSMSIVLGNQDSFGLNVLWFSDITICATLFTAVKVPTWRAKDCRNNVEANTYWAFSVCQALGYYPMQFLYHPKRETLLLTPFSCKGQVQRHKTSSPMSPNQEELESELSSACLQRLCSGPWLPVTLYQVPYGLASKWLNRISPSPAVRGRAPLLALSVLQKLFLASAQALSFSSVLPGRPLLISMAPIWQQAPE